MATKVFECGCQCTVEGEEWLHRYLSVGVSEGEVVHSI